MLRESISIPSEENSLGLPEVSQAFLLETSANANEHKYKPITAKKFILPKEQNVISNVQSKSNYRSQMSTAGLIVIIYQSQCCYLFDNFGTSY